MGTGFNVVNFSGGNPLEIRSDNLGGRRSGPRGRGDRVYGRCGRSRGKGDSVDGRRGGNWVGPIRRRPINSNKKPQY